MSDEYFYGITLSASHKSETWDPEAKELSPGNPNSKLLIRQALLGPDAKPDELNVIQVETMSLQEAVKIPVAVLKVGETRHVRLDLEFPDAPVTFELIQGSGPVHIVGQNVLGGIPQEEFEDMEEMEEEMIDDEEGDDSQFKEDENKRKSSAGKRKPNEEEDDEEGEPKGKKAKMSNNAKGKAASPKKNAKK